MAKAVAKKAAAKKVVKRSPVKKAVKAIKYSDKSAGQPQLTPIFNELVKLMAPYEKKGLKKNGGKDGQFSLISPKQVVIAGKKVDDPWFCGLLVQKGYVGFYFMPVYTVPEMKLDLAPGLLKQLKGKSCFHIKKWDKELSEDVEDALEKGYAIYKKNGWIG